MRLQGSVLLLAMAVPAVGAQSRATLIGSVRDSTGAALSLVQLAIGDTRAITDTAGRFTFIALPAGTTSVTVRRLGFAPRNVPVQLADGRTDSIHVRLLVLPAYLPSLVADAEALDRIRLADFHRHRKTGLGAYFNRRQIDSTRYTRISDLMRRIPGVRLVPDRTGRPQMRISRGGNCTPDFWIDGQRTPHLNVDDVPLGDVEALEVYRGATGLPPEYNVRFGNPGCGAVIIWTRLR
jgi:hypothetical protein